MNIGETPVGVRIDRWSQYRPLESGSTVAMNIDRRNKHRLGVKVDCLLASNTCNVKETYLHASKYLLSVTAVGFEPTHPKIVELESTAFDHSAKLSYLCRHASNHLSFSKACIVARVRAHTCVSAVHVRRRAHVQSCPHAGTCGRACCRTCDAHGRAAFVNLWPRSLILSS